jgi:uncharacterized membrane protein YraQ (UPF0718 family)
MKMADKCEHCEPGTPFYKERVFIVLVITLSLLLISFLIKPLNPFYVAFIEYLRLIWWAVLLGFLLGGVIDYFVPEETVMRFLGKREKRTIFFAVIFGFLMTACSHGILAISMQLYKKGASTASVIAFLLASPWANLPMTVLLFGFFGFKAIFLVVSAIVIAIITGFVYQLLEKYNLIGEHRHKKTLKIKKVKIKKDIKSIVKGVSSGSWNLTKMVLWWILIGMLMASFARAFIPHHIFMKYMGPSLLGLFVTLVLATIIEVCSEGSSPLAFEIYNQTAAFGNAFTFLMAGVATDYTEIGLIWSNIGKKAAIWLPIITIPQILLVSYLFNILI